MIEHHEDCISHENDMFCDCDFWDRLAKEQEEYDESRKVPAKGEGT